MKTLVHIAGLSALCLNALPMALACSETGRDGIFEENTLNYPVEMNFTGVEEDRFNALIDEVASIYVPIFETTGRPLRIDRKWDDGTVNAYAKREGGRSVVAMFGGMARHPLVTADGFQLVVCHEIGHHLGGAPRKPIFWIFDTWAADEGQADYFGALKCMRKVLATKDNEGWVKANPVPLKVTQECQKQYTTGNEIAMCERISMAGMSLASTLASIRGSAAPKFDTPDTKAVDKTFHDHPAAQCRLDTYFQASLCNRPVDAPLSRDNPATSSTCNSETGDTIGIRPICWYKPAR